MRVLLISHTCQSAVEGQPKAELLAREEGVDLTVLVPDRWYHYGKWRFTKDFAQGAKGGPKYLKRKIRWAWTGAAQWYLHWYPDLAKVLREVQPKIIDMWEEPWGLASAHTCWLRNRIVPHAKIITETEQNVEKELPFPFEQFRSYTLRNAAFAVGRNTESLAILRKKGFRGEAAVVPNGVDPELFRPLPRESCRSEFDLNRFTAGYVGRLVEEKGLMDLVDALAHCSADIDLLFVGSGPMKERLERRAQELGKAERVRFVSELPMEKLPTVMNAIDVLVLPSRTTKRWKEQFGRVLIEAHACGTPVIGSDSGAIPSVIGNGGLVVPERNPAELGKALSRLAGAPDECRALGLAGRSQVEEQYTWARVAQQMRRVYERVQTSRDQSEPGWRLGPPTPPVPHRD